MTAFPFRRRNRKIIRRRVVPLPARRAPEVHVLLGIAWLTTVLAASVLALRYRSLPEFVPTYAGAWGLPVRLAPKSPWTVGRVAAMGAGQVGAASGMAVGSQASSGWQRFWTAVAIAAALKTWAECQGFASIRATDARVWAVASAIPVLAVLVFSIRAWRRGALGAPPRVSPLPRFVTALSLFIWLAFAVFPWLHS